MAAADFDAWVEKATGHRPYAYQRRLAEHGLPGLLRVPTGAGKTLAATLPWLWRRRFHPDAVVREETPRRLVVVLPQRSLVEQTVEVVGGWLGRLGLAGEVGLHVLMGGESTDDRAWKLNPGADAILVGTQDMVLSRLLMRGYAESRASWPMAFGLLHSSSQFVFDEVQLMGPALPTSLQLEGLRRRLGTPALSRSMWMSATVDPARLATVDHQEAPDAVELTAEDRVGPLLRRLEATRRVRRGDLTEDVKKRAAGLAEVVVAGHTPGTRTLVVLNTVDRATDLYAALTKAKPAAAVVLLHSRFRPDDRKRHAGAALAEPPAAGLIVVATQVLEAGVDVSSRLLVTEVAPWSSVVQRAGRCNRAGEYDDAELVWIPVPTGRTGSAPYAEGDLTAAAEALTSLEGERVTSVGLQERGVAEDEPLHPVLRHRDLLDLFDTAPDLTGNDLDVSRWIRDPDVASAAVAWRTVDAEGLPDDAPYPDRAELCAVPVQALREAVAMPGRRAWVPDQLGGGWRRADRHAIRPGGVVVMDAAGGGYLPDRGWSPSDRTPVDPVSVPAPQKPVDAVIEDGLTVGCGRWISLTQHSADVEQEVGTVLGELGGPAGVDRVHRETAVLAGLLHDLGKAHPVFADSLAKAVGGGSPDGGPWAKSPGKGRLRHRRPYFRHELVSALLLLDQASGLLDGVPEPDLVAYLVAAHHGKVRLSVRPMPKEDGSILGVATDATGEPTAGVTLPDGRVVPSLLPRVDLLALGSGEHGDSWQARACRLRDRPDLGPFRLAFLETVVRVADWRASARYDEGRTP